MNMSGDTSKLSLCTFSKSSILQSSILNSCPLNLNKNQSQTCECRRRVNHVPPCDLRVLSCTFPNRWDGKPLSNFASGESKSWLNEGVKKMSAVATEAGVEKIDKQENSAGQKGGGIWGGTKIPIIGVTGEKFSGKTLFLASIDPDRTCMIDLEDSSESYNIQFAKRISLYDEMLKKFGRAATPVESYVWFMDLIEGLKPGEFSVLAVDPYSDIQAGLVDWVKANPTKFGHTANQYEKASGLLWSDVKQHCKMMLGILSRKVETFAFSTHMGSVWKGGAPTEKRKAKGLDTLFELASLYLELERRPDDKGKVDKKPAGKVLKSRLAISRMVDGELEHFPILPPRLPVATPAAIRDYIKNPPDYAKLKKGELVEKEVLSDDEKLVIQAEVANVQLEIEQAKLSQMEMLKLSAEKQDELRRRQAAAKAAAMKPEGANGHVKAAAVESTSAQSEPVTEKSTVRDRIDKVLGPEPNPLEPVTEDGPTVHEIIESQKKQLGITEAQWAGILGKRNVKTTAELTKEQAEEIRVALWNKLTVKEMAKATAGQGSTANASKN